MKISVLGAGAWGAALAKVLHENGHAVTLWDINADLLAELRQGRSERLLPGAKLPTGWNTETDFEKAVAGREVLVMAIPSQFFRARAPEGFHLFSVRTGGARHPEAGTRPEAELVALADGELRGLLGLSAGPSFVHIVRHERALPQYTLGHMGRVALLEEGERRHPGLFFHGNAYHNAGVPELVSRSAKLAERVVGFIE